MADEPNTPTTNEPTPIRPGISADNEPATGSPSGTKPPDGRVVRKLTIAERQAEALRLKKQGTPYDQIAAALGFKSESGARYAVESALKKHVSGAVQELRTLQHLRLEAMVAALWPLVMNGGTDAGFLLIRVLERQAKLMGLDQPTKIDITHRIRERAIAEGLDPDEAVRTVQEMLREGDFRVGVG